MARVNFVTYKYNPTASDGSTVELYPIVNSGFGYDTVTQTADDGNKLVALRSDESYLSNLTMLQFGGRVISQYLISVDDLNVSTLTTAKSMFMSCYNLKTLDLSNFNTSNVTDMNSMFDNCTSLTSLDLSNFDTSNVTDMECMFYGCSSLTSLDISNWDTSNVTSKSWMFNNCTSLRIIKCNNAATINKIASELPDRSANSIPGTMVTTCSESDLDVTTLSSKGWNIADKEPEEELEPEPEPVMIDFVKYTFNPTATDGSTVDLIPTMTSIAYTKTDVTNADGTITRALSCEESDIAKIKTLQFSYYKTDNKTKSLISVDELNVSTLTDAQSMFYGCQNLVSVNTANFDTSNVTNMYCMFYNCNKLTQLDLSNFDTSKVTTMYFMFSKCYALTTIGDVSNWDTGKVTSMENMFATCYELTALDVSNWDTSNVTTMKEMFNYCNKLTSLDVTNWDTSKVTNMKYMFNGCQLLTELNLSGWDTSNVTDMSYMFCYCYDLKMLDISNFTIGGSTKLSAFIYSCYDLKDIGMIYCDQYTVDTVVSFINAETDRTIWVKEDIVQEALINSCTYKVYKENSKIITLNEPLRAIGDIKDKFIKRDGKWYVERNCGEFTIKSSTPINIETPSETAAIVSIDRVYVNNMKVNSGITLLICSDFKSENNYSAPYYTYINPTNIVFTLPLTANTSSKAHEILDGTKFVYLLEHPTYEEIEDPTVFILSENINILNTSSIPSNMIVQNTSYTATGVKPNTQYTVISDNPVQGVYLCGTEVSMNSNIILITTPRELADNDLIFYGTGEVGNIMLIEGDYRNNDFEYFTGSVEVGKTVSGKYTFVEDEE